MADDISGDDFSFDHIKEGPFIFKETESVKVEEPVKKKLDASGLVHDDLKMGMYVKLKCGCEGFIKDIGGNLLGEDRWISVLATKSGCRSSSGLFSMETLYAEVPSRLKIDTYHSDAFAGILPAYEAVAPSWMKSVYSMPRSANERRAIRVRLAEGEEFIIPGALSSSNVYSMANSLREMIKGTGSSISVIENVDSIDKDHLGEAPNLFKRCVALKNETIDEKNVHIFYNWAVSLLYSSSNGEDITEMGSSVLSRDNIRIAMASVSKHPMWKGSRIEVTSKEGYVVILGPDGKIT